MIPKGQILAVLLCFFRVFETNGGTVPAHDAAISREGGPGIVLSQVERLLPEMSGATLPQPIALSASSDGTNFLLSWVDNSGPTNIYVARVDRSGALLDPGGISMVEGDVSTMASAVAFRDDAFLLGYGIAGRYGWENWHTNVAFCQLGPEGLQRLSVPISAARFTSGTQKVLVASSDTAFIVAYRDNQSLKYQLISRNGIPGRLLSGPASFVPLLVTPTPDGFLILSSHLGLWATLIDREGRLKTSDHLFVAESANRVMAATNDSGILIIAPSSYRRLSFDGVLGPSGSHPLGNLTWGTLFGVGEKWVEVLPVQRSLRIRQITDCGTTLEHDTQYRTLNLPLAVQQVAAMNRFGDGIAACATKTDIFFQHWTLAGAISDGSGIERSPKRRALAVTGNTNGYSILYETGTTNLEASVAFIGRDGGIESMTSLTNYSPRFGFTVQGAAGTLGSNQLFLVQGAGGWMADRTKPLSPLNPVYVPGLRRGPAQIVTGTNEFVVFSGPYYSGSAIPVSLEGEVGPAVEYADAAAFASSNSEILGVRIKDVLLEAFGVDFGAAGSWKWTGTGSRSSPKIAGNSSGFLLVWEETDPSRTLVYLKAGRFTPGQANRPPLTLFQVARSNSFSVTASETGFLIAGRDGMSAEAGRMSREYFIHVPADSDAVQVATRAADFSNFEPAPMLLGLKQDFLVVRTRTDDGFYLTSQAIMPGSTLPQLGVSQNRDAFGILFQTDATRKSVLESSEDLLLWRRLDEVEGMGTLTPGIDGGHKFFRAVTYPE